AVLVKVKSSMKVNPIIVKFSGAIYLHAKDKEVITLFQTSKTIPVNKKVLEPKDYSFPFEFLVPENLPSAMDFGKQKIARIAYKLTAILDRPMVPESLCPKVEYPVLVLECVDVTKDNFVKPLERQKQVAFNNGQCQIKLTVPRTGFTRGETVPVNVIVNTSQSFVKKEAISINLVRKVKIKTSRNTLDEEHILKSNKLDLNIIGPYNFSQSITTQLLIRTTPPTIRYKDQTLRIHYKIRAQLFSNEKKTPIGVVELPIVIGTWPRADVPIDDDDDQDIIQNMGEMMIGDETDDDEDGWIENESEYKKAESLRRSGSNSSMRSASSWMSHRLSLGSHQMIPEHHRNTISSFNLPECYLNKSSSTPDLLAPLQGRTRVIDPAVRNSFYETSSEHRPSHSIHSIQSTFSQPQHRRVGSDSLSSPPLPLPLPPPPPQVPNHILTFMADSSVPQPRRIEPDVSDSDLSDEDDDDLFAIIEKKKKRQEKELRQKQRQMYTLKE
ncbi:hypothetical protein CU098_009452, partial [Rhizopus stolonifer]